MNEYDYGYDYDYDYELNEEPPAMDGKLLSLSAIEAI